MDSKVRECVLLGFQEGTKGYLVYDPQRRQIFTSRDVTFDETSPFFAPAPRHPGAQPKFKLKWGDNTDAEIVGWGASEDGEYPHRPTSEEEDDEEEEEFFSPCAPESACDREVGGEGGGPAAGQLEEAFQQLPVVQEDFQLPQEHRRPRVDAEEWKRRVGTRGPSTRSRNGPYANKASSPPVGIPKSAAEALSPEQEHLWRSPMEEEMASMEANGVWELVPPPPGKNIVGSRWVFAEKTDDQGVINRRKGRCVAQGFYQRPGVDFDETYASVVNKATIRTMLHLAATHDMHVHQMDVKTAYLNGDLKEEVYMRQPPGFEDQQHPDWVCKLKKSIYGLKQSARCWYQRLKDELVHLGFKVNPMDHSLFQKEENGKRFFVLVYVDDLVLIADNLEDLGEFKRRMTDKFVMTDLGEISYYLGLHVVRDKDRKTVFLHQRQYIKEVLERFGMADSHAVKTPLAAEHDLTVPEDFKEGEEEEMRQVPYAQVVGSLMYIMTCTRPDLAYAVGVLSRYMAEGAHRRKHWTAAKRVLRYLKGTADHGILLGGPQEVQLTVEVDSSWADNINNRKSTQGFISSLGSGPLTWKSQKSEVVALSTAEAEYYAAGTGGREVQYLRQLLKSLGHAQAGPTQMWCDNKAAVAISHNPEFHSRTKHIDLRHHWIREQVELGHLAVSYVPTADNAADIMTKALGEPKHRAFLQQLKIMGLQEFQGLQQPNP